MVIYNLRTESILLDNILIVNYVFLKELAGLFILVDQMFFNIENKCKNQKKKEIDERKCIKVIYNFRGVILTFFQNHSKHLVIILIIVTYMLMKD